MEDLNRRYQVTYNHADKYDNFYYRISAEDYNEIETSCDFEDYQYKPLHKYVKPASKFNKKETTVFYIKIKKVSHPKYLEQNKEYTLNLLFKPWEMNDKNGVTCYIK